MAERPPVTPDELESALNLNDGSLTYRLAAMIQRYNDMITWMTDCANCAELMNKNVEHYFENERLKERVAELERETEQLCRLLKQANASHARELKAAHGLIREQHDRIAELERGWTLLRRVTAAGGGDG